MAYVNDGTGTQTNPDPYADPNIDPATGLPYNYVTPPPPPSNYIDPGTGDSSTTAPPPPDYTTQSAPPGFHWAGGVLVQDTGTSTVLPPPPSNNYLDPGYVSPTFRSPKGPGGTIGTTPFFTDPITGDVTGGTSTTTAPQFVPSTISGVPDSSAGSSLPDAPTGFHWEGGTLVQDAGTSTLGELPPPPPIIDQPPVQPPPPQTIDPTNQAAPDGFHWENGVLTQDAALDTRGAIPLPPPPPSLPQEGLPVGPVGGSFSAGPGASAFGRAQGAGFSGGFSGPNQPGGGGFRPQAPLWARGIQRSPFMQFLARSGNPDLFGLRFQPEAPVEDEELRRRQELEASGQIPEWAMGLAG